MRKSPENCIKKPSKAQTSTLQGIIIPSAWDKDGNVVTISLSTFDEEEYCIGNNRHWRALMALLRERVLISGVVSHSKGRQTIRVKDFQRIGEGERGVP